MNSEDGSFENVLPLISELCRSFIRLLLLSSCYLRLLMHYWMSLWLHASNKKKINECSQASAIVLLRTIMPGLIIFVQFLLNHITLYANKAHQRWKPNGKYKRVYRKNLTGRGDELCLCGFLIIEIIGSLASLSGQYICRSLLLIIFLPKICQTWLCLVWVPCRNYSRLLYCPVESVDFVRFHKHHQQMLA